MSNKQPRTLVTGDRTTNNLLIRQNNPSIQFSELDAISRPAAPQPRPGNPAVEIPGNSRIPADFSFPEQLRSADIDFEKRNRLRTAGKSLRVPDPPVSPGFSSSRDRNQSDRIPARIPVKSSGRQQGVLLNRLSLTANPNVNPECLFKLC